jgi:hypothetical protein
MLKKLFQHKLSIVLLPIIWLQVRYSIGLLTHFDSTQGSHWGVMTHLLLVLLSILLAMIQCHWKREYDFIHLFKNSAKHAILYALLVTGSLGIYYGWLSDELIIKKQQDIAQIIQETDSPEKIAQIKSLNPALQPLSKDQIVEKAMERTTLLTNLKTMLSLAFFSLTILGFIYSLIAAWLFSQFLFTKK